MKKHQIMSLATVICYLAFIVLGILLALGMYHIGFGGGSDAEGIGKAFLSIVSLLLVVLGGAYAFFALTPFILKLISIWKPKRLLAIFCIPFDVCFLVVHTLLLINVIETGATSEVWQAILLLLLPIGTLTLNILTIAMKKRG